MTGAATIFALSTAPGRAAIAVYRVSGPDAGAALRRLTGLDHPAPRRAIRVRICDPEEGSAIDDGLAVWFPGPASYTGEDVVELHVHGGRATVDALGLALGRIAGLRPAEPGEFTRRAFLAGKLELTQVEAIADLIGAETEAQRRQALRQAEGALGALYDGWREALIRALAHMEAAIDFPDEDLPESVEEALLGTIGRLAAEIGGHLDDGRRGERLRDGVSIAILGPPNVGKSSLLNALARREAAIVSTRAGTTRDVIEVHLDLGGYPAILADTAGLRPTEDEIEREGVARALARAAAADIRLVMLDATTPEALGAEFAGLVDERALVVANQVDLQPLPAGTTVGGRPVHAVSVRTGEGLEALVAILAREVAARAELTSAPAPTRVRHRIALENCRAALIRAASASATELRAEDLRAAAQALGQLTGRVGVEDLLDVIFRDFCIGK